VKQVAQIAEQSYLFTAIVQACFKHT